MGGGFCNVLQLVTVDDDCGTSDCISTERLPQALGWDVEGVTDLAGPVDCLNTVLAPDVGDVKESPGGFLNTEVNGVAQAFDEAGAPRDWFSLKLL